MKNFENIFNSSAENTEEDEPVVNELEKKENTEAENQEAQLFLDKEKSFMENLSGKAKTVARAMVLCTALATVGCSNVEDRSVAEKPKHIIEESQQKLDKSKYPKNERVRRILQKELKRARERRDQTKESIKRASELADKMGIAFDPDNVVVKTEGFVPTVINGKDIPVDMYTAEERKNIERARKISQPLENHNENEDRNNNKNESKKKIRSNVTQSNDYMDLSDF